MRLLEPRRRFTRRFMTFPCSGLAVLLAVVPLAVAPTAHADSLVVPASDARNLAAGGGWLAWAASAGNGRWRLLLRSPLGIVTTPTIADFGTAPDPSLGRDRGGGRLYAIYSRCRGSSSLAGCDVYRYDVTAGAESRVAALATSRYSETAPSLASGRWAFVRRGAHASGVYTWTSGARARRLSGTLAQETAVNESRVAYTFGAPGRGSVAVRRLLGSGNLLVATSAERTVPTSLLFTGYRANWILPAGDVGVTVVRTSSIGIPETGVRVRSGQRNLPLGTDSIASDGSAITRYLDREGVKTISPRLFQP